MKETVILSKSGMLYRGQDNSAWLCEQAVGQHLGLNDSLESPARSIRLTYALKNPKEKGFKKYEFFPVANESSNRRVNISGKRFGNSRGGNYISSYLRQVFEYFFSQEKQVCWIKIKEL